MYMIRQGFDASLARPLAAALLALSASAIAVPAVAGPMPSPGAEATASARSVGNDAGTNVSLTVDGSLQVGNNNSGAASMTFSPPWA